VSAAAHEHDEPGRPALVDPPTGHDDPDVDRIDDTRRASPRDRLTVHGHHVGEHDRIGEILEVRDHGGERSYLVRWDEDGHESIVYPGTDATVHHYSEHDDPDHDDPEHGESGS